TAVYSGDAQYFQNTGVYQQAVQAQQFTLGDQFVERLGDGTTPLIAQSPNPVAGLGAVGSTIYLDEYSPGTTTATLIQPIILPSYDGTGTQTTIHAIVGDGQQSNTAQLSLSGDSKYLFLTGYDQSLNGGTLGTAFGLPNPSSNSQDPAVTAAVPRGVA